MILHKLFEYGNAQVEYECWLPTKSVTDTMVN
jgi:hypothetical protein